MGFELGTTIIWMNLKVLALRSVEGQRHSINFEISLVNIALRIRSRLRETRTRPAFVNTSNVNIKSIIRERIGFWKTRLAVIRQNYPLIRANLRGFFCC